MEEIHVQVLLVFNGYLLERAFLCLNGRYDQDIILIDPHLDIDLVTFFHSRDWNLTQHDIIFCFDLGAFQDDQGLVVLGNLDRLCFLNRYDAVLRYVDIHGLGKLSFRKDAC